jgi:Tol biopolymer transport system component
VADRTPRPPTSSTDATPRTRLDSWKEIAAYLKRNVTTVRRWEKREGLPVHRHPHDQRDSVYAYVDEIDHWWETRRHSIVRNEATEGGGPDAGSHAADVNAVAGETQSRAVGWAWLSAATLCSAAIALGLSLPSPDATPAENALERRFAVDPPSGLSFIDVEISPDGRYLAFTAASQHDDRLNRMLWIQRSDSLEARALPGTESASLPFWSPSSDALGFFAEGHLWTIDLAGKSPRRLAPAPDGRGGTWNRDGVIVFAPGRTGELYRVASTGGPATLVTRLVEGERGHVWPNFLPDGRHFTYLAHPNGRPNPNHRVFVAALDGSLKRQLLSTDSGVLYSDGYLLYQRERRLFAQRFDLQRLELSGEPLSVTEAVLDMYAYPPKWAFSVSSRSTLIYRVPQSPTTRLVWRDRTGRSSPLLDTPGNYSDPALAPDETHVVYSRFDPEPSKRHGYGPVDITSNLYVLERASGRPLQLTFDPAMESGAVWSPDSKSIVYYSSGGDDATELFYKDMINPRGVDVPLATEGFNPGATSWSSDGRYLAYSTFSRKTRSDVWLLPMSGDRTPIPVLQSEFGEEQGQISPDGRWLAYTSDESGKPEVWVTTLPGATAKWRVSDGGGGDPRWRSDGRELFYIAADRQLMAIAVGTGATFAHGQAVALFDTGVPAHWYEARNLYDVSRDGRFLFLSPVEDDRSAPAVMILNWSARVRTPVK